MRNVDQKIFDVQKEKYTIKKTGYNSHTKSKYAKLDDILEALKPVLEKHNLLAIHFCEPDEENNWALVTKIINVEKTDEVRAFCCPIPGISQARNPMHAVGAGMTYGMRYNLTGAFNLEADDDDGNSFEKPRPTPPVGQKNFNNQRRQTI